MNHDELKILLSAYIDGEVTPSEKDLVENHLVSCQSCQKDFDEFKKVSSSLKRWPQERLSPDVELNIKARLAKTKERTMEKQELSIQWSAVVGVVVIVTLFAGVQQYARRGLQARVRDANLYLSSQTQTVALGKTDQYEPYYLSSNYAVDRNEGVIQGKSKGYESGQSAAKRLKSATDDIGDQFSPENVGYKKEEMGAVAGGFRVMEQKQVTSGELLSRNVVGNESEARVYSQPASTIDSPNQVVAQPYPYPPQREIYPYNPPSVESESYDRIAENGFHSPEQEPLSTFSIDVDTASYSNVRRFLNQGQLPPPDAVRIEEMINYFNYEYPEPGWGQPFSVNTEVTSCPWNPSHQLALIGLQGKRLNSLTMPASNLVFLIDVSGSMNSPNKLPLLQDAFRMMAQELESKDRVSIVVYAGAAGMILDATPGNYKDLIMTAVARLQAGGSTAGGAGIQLAYQTALAHLIPNGNNRVILATDGDFNVGVSDDTQLVNMIRSYRDKGIYLTVLGFGMGNYKDSKMEKLADQGNGNYFYIDNINEARKVMVNELGSTLFTIAKDVKLQVEFNPATVAGYRLIGYENRTLAKEDFNDDTKDAGELGAGHTVTALYEIIPANGYLESSGRVDPLVYQKSPQIAPRNIFASSDMMTVKLRYKDPKGMTSKLIKKTVGRNDLRMNPKSENIRFASAVAEFGLLLRNSPYRGIASFDHVINEVRAAKSDKFGYRIEFLDLVERAKLLNPYLQPLPVDDTPVIMYRYDNGYSPHQKNQK